MRVSLVSWERKAVLAALIAVAAIWALAPAGASAAVCGADSTAILIDPGGYQYDFNAAGTTLDRADPFAVFANGGSDVTNTPPGPRNTADSWDDWGALFVGPGGDASLSNLYFSPDNNSCALEDGAREQVFPPVTLNGLVVQRKVFVAASGMPGARVLDLITNPGGSPVTTSVQFGDTLSPSDDGDLGSDTETAIRASSNGDLALTPADLWSVTSDHDGTIPGTQNSDLALAHVMDGLGGADRVDFATLTAEPLHPTQFDHLAWRWDNVAILPGQTAAFISYEIQQGVPDANAAAEDAGAANQANAYEAAPFSTLFQGMTPTEIAAVRNWPTETCFGARPTLSGTTGPDKLKGTNGADVIAGLGGKDKISGLGGKDKICGDAGKDNLSGGAGNDKIAGGAGKDKLVGGKGKDKLVGGKGKDIEQQ
jgi:Ca2+-binding RTX toxin-like protein